jgi:hypothetical protein
LFPRFIQARNKKKSLQNQRGLLSAHTLHTRGADKKLKAFSLTAKSRWFLFLASLALGRRPTALLSLLLLLLPGKNLRIGKNTGRQSKERTLNTNQRSGAPVLVCRHQVHPDQCGFLGGSSPRASHGVTRAKASSPSQYA